MATARVRFTMKSGAAIQVIGPMVDRAAYSAAQKTRGRVLANIRRLGRIDTGKMIGGVQVRRVTGTGLAVAYSIYSTATYTIYQEAGTRAHGPRTAKFMVFTPKGSGQVVFAKWVRGVTPGHFFADALAQAQASDAVP
jgi:hypothetical protein